MNNKLLTIGMSTYDDFDGVYFTVQSLRTYHSVLKNNDIEIIVLDNNPDSVHGQETAKFINGWAADVANMFHSKINRLLLISTR